MVRWSKKKVLLTLWTIITLSYTFYAEYFLYIFNSNNWFPLTCSKPNHCTKILIVADPQIIGNLNEIIHFLTPFTIFDSDKYLKTTYSVAYNFVKPDVVLFLGDLMDEASIASDDDFNEYVQRILNIFVHPYKNSNSVKHIWLPGDNDIGGEDTRLTPKNMQRFSRAFSQSSLNKINNITFFKINRLTSIIPVYKKERDFYDTKKIFIGLSHVPLMFRPSKFVERVIDKMLPHVLFTAHEHKSMIISTDAHLQHKDYHIIPITPDNTQIYEYTLGMTDMYEIIIPTCSYRMGTNHVGYGYGLVENNELKFTILWSPSRFEYLIIYAILFILPLCVSCLIKLRLCFLVV